VLRRTVAGVLVSWVPFFTPTIDAETVSLWWNVTFDMHYSTHFNAWRWCFWFLNSCLRESHRHWLNNKSHEPIKITTFKFSKRRWWHQNFGFVRVFVRVFASIMVLRPGITDNINGRCLWWTLVATLLLLAFQAFPGLYSCVVVAAEFAPDLDGVSHEMVSGRCRVWKIEFHRRVGDVVSQ
jgi:hypothetical protein